MLPVYLAYVPVPSQVPMNYLRMFQFCDKSYMLKYLKWFEQTKMYKIIVTKLLVDLIKMDKKIYVVADLHYGHKNIVSGVSNWNNKAATRNFENAKEIAGEYEILIEKKVALTDIEDCVQNILKKTNSLLSYKEGIIERIKQENTMGVEISMFSIYNGINYFLQPAHNEFITNDSVKRRQMDEKILDYVFELVA
jgi:hypothetical protein